MFRNSIPKTYWPLTDVEAMLATRALVKLIFRIDILITYVELDVWQSVGVMYISGIMHMSSGRSWIPHQKLRLFFIFKPLTEYHVNMISASGGTVHHCHPGHPDCIFSGFGIRFFHQWQHNKARNVHNPWDVLYDDVIKWKHFPRYWPFVRRIHRSPVNSPHKGQWRGVLMFSAPK